MKWCFKVFLVRILFADRPIASEMGVLKVFILYLLAYCIE